MSTFVFSGLVVLVGIVGSIALLLIVRRFINVDILRQHHTIAGNIFAVVGTLNAVLLGMVVIEAQSRFQQARNNEATEANSIADVRMNAKHLPEPTRGRVDEHVRKYIKLVLEQEWDAPKEQQPNPLAVNQFQTIWNSVAEFTPADNRETNIQSLMLNELSQSFDLRRTRITTGRFGFPGILWTVMIIGSLITEVFGCMFAADNFRLQSFMVALLGITLCMSMLVVFVLGSPYSGDWKIRPEQFLRMAKNKPFPPRGPVPEIEEPLESTSTSDSAPATPASASPVSPASPVPATPASPEPAAGVVAH